MYESMSALIEIQDRFSEDHAYFHLKRNRDKLRAEYVRAGKMADPDSRTELSQAIDMVGECVTMCPEYETMEREYQQKLDPMELVLFR